MIGMRQVAPVRSPGLRRARISPATYASATASHANRKKAIVIGGGIGGLTTAGRLAKEGFHVTLLEQNQQVRYGVLKMDLHVDASMHGSMSGQLELLQTNTQQASRCYR